MTRVRPAETAVLALVLAVFGALFARRIAAPSLEFDEGVYLTSADLLTRGLGLGRDVFTSQPPLFLTLLDGASELLGGDAAALRAVAVAITLGGAVAGWLLVRRIAGPRPAAAAAGLALLAPGVVDAAAVVSADLPCVALGTGALAAARAAQRRRAPSRGAASLAAGPPGASALAAAALAGGLLAAALLVKLLAAPFAVALAAAALVDRPPPRAVACFAAGAAAVFAAVLVPYADVLDSLWAGAVGVHLDARDAEAALPIGGPPFSAVFPIVLAYAGLVAVLAAGLASRERAELRRWARERADLLALLAAGVALVAVHRPLMHHHLVIMAWPLALLAGSTLPSRRHLLAIAAAGALFLAPLAIAGRGTLSDTERGRLRAAAELVRSGTAPGQTVVSDLPLVPLLAGRPSAPETVDPSYVRVGAGGLDRRAILAAADRAGAVVVGRSFARVNGLERALVRRFPRTVALSGGVRVHLRRKDGLFPATTDPGATPAGAPRSARCRAIEAA